MKAYLLTSDNCPPCVELKEHFADLIKTGEILEKNLERDAEETTALMQKYEAALPSLLIIADNGDLVLSI